MLRESLSSTMTSKIGSLLSRDAYTDFKKRLDYSEYGGAPLLGVKGVCIVCHGRSNANAVKNAIRVAAEFAQGRVNEKIEEELDHNVATSKVTAP
jgi:glycerol-3-phosphate acyltransferase PlsX